MESYRIMLAAGLLSHKLVWEILRPRAVKARAHATGVSSTVVLIKIVKVCVLGFLIVQTLFLQVFPLTNDPSSLRIIGLCLFGIGLGIAVLGRIHLGENWVDLEEYQVVPGQALVTKGIYGYIRHPIYAGDILLLLGLQLAVNSWLVIAAIIPAAVALRNVRAEEKILARAFPNYPEYCRRTKKFIPFLF